MRPYNQDSVVPIYITLTYMGDYGGLGDGKVPNSIKFPINPETLEKQIPSASETVDIEGIGQVSIPISPRLATMTIKSFFWFHNPDIIPYPSSVYVAWLEKWQKSKKPAHLVITRLNYSMQVTCESFKHWINAGEEDDVYFELQLKEYKNYGAKKLSQLKNFNLIETMQKVKGFEIPPMLYEIPRPIRKSVDFTNKKTISNPYVVTKNETISSITKKITGSTKDWELLYQQNKKILGDIDSEIPVGTKLTLPTEWIQNTNYKIISK